MTRQVRLLLILSALFVLALAFGISQCPRRRRVTTPFVPRSERPEIPVRTGGRVRLDLLQRETEPGVEVRHNLFAPLDGTADLAAGVESPPEEPLDDEPVVVEEIRPRFLGFLRQQGRQKIFFGLNGDVFIVAVGERFGPDGMYRLREARSELLVVEERRRPQPHLIAVDQRPVWVLSGAAAETPRVGLEDIGPPVTNGAEPVLPANDGATREEVSPDEIIDD